MNTEDRFSQESSQEFSNGDVIFHEGDSSRDMYIVQSGEVELSKKSAQGFLKLGKLKKGEVFGEMAFLESLPRTATAKAKGPTRLLVLQPGGFLLKIRRDPTLAFELMQQLSRKIRKTNEQLVDYILHGAEKAGSLESLVTEMNVENFKK